MSKQCSGKYHGTGIKYINDNERYCKVCQQHMNLKKKRRNEVVGGSIISVPVIILGIKKLINLFNKKNKA